MEVKYNQEVAKPVVKRGSNNKYHPPEPFTACHGMHRLVKKGKYFTSKCSLSNLSLPIPFAGPWSICQTLVRPLLPFPFRS